jgi:hypothetical protein
MHGFSDRALLPAPSLWRYLPERGPARRREPPESRRPGLPGGRRPAGTLAAPEGKAFRVAVPGAGSGLEARA